MLPTSVTRWLDYFSIFGHFQHQNLPNRMKVDKIGRFKFRQTLKNPSENCPKDFKILPKMAKFRQIWSHCYLPIASRQFVFNFLPRKE